MIALQQLPELLRRVNELEKRIGGNSAAGPGSDAKHSV
jgi:hypothetical protein